MQKRTWLFIAVMIGFVAGGLVYRHFAQDVDSRGATRLMRAIEENDTPKVLKLLPASDVNIKDKAGQTALFYAARHATDPKVIYQLLMAGADPLLTDKHGNTPLITAAEHNPAAAVVLALAKQKGAQQQTDKDQALVRAARYNTAEVVKVLLISHANPVGIAGKEAATYLAENEKLSEQEKTDYRQVMLMLEILQAREQFDKATQAAKPKNQTGSKKVKEAKKEVPKEVSAPQTMPEHATVGTEQQATLPREKQMSDEE